MSKTTEEMAREVYEAITGKCWHNHAQLSVWCKKCGAEYDGIDNPPLATSIDAWHEHIFPVMSDEQRGLFNAQLIDIAIFTKNGIKYLWQATAMHHLTAAYNVVKGE